MRPLPCVAPPVAATPGGPRPLARGLCVRPYLRRDHVVAGAGVHTGLAAAPSGPVGGSGLGSPPPWPPFLQREPRRHEGSCESRRGERIGAPKASRPVPLLTMASHIILPPDDADENHNHQEAAEEEEREELGRDDDDDDDEHGPPPGLPPKAALPFSATCVRISRDSYPKLRAPPTSRSRGLLQVRPR